MVTDTDSGIDAQFESIDWDELDGGALSVGWQTVAFLVGCCLLVALFCYDFFTKYDLSVGAWYTAERLDWLFLLSVLVFAFVVVAPLVTDRRRTVQYW